MQLNLKKPADNSIKKWAEDLNGHLSPTPFQVLPARFDNGTCYPLPPPGDKWKCNGRGLPSSLHPRSTMMLLNASLQVGN